MEGALREGPANALGKIPAGAAALVDLGAVVDLGTAAPAVVVLTFEALAPVPSAGDLDEAFAAGVGLLLVSIFRFRLTVNNRICMQRACKRLTGPTVVAYSFSFSSTFTD